MMSNDVRTISLNGADLGYSVHGVGAGKPSLIFVHGALLRGTGAIYVELLELLARSHVVYALDLRGHGASAAAVDGWTFDTMADDVVAFSLALGLDRPVCLGHSLGAFVSLLAEIRHPGAFLALGLLAPGPADPRGDPIEALQLFTENKHDREFVSEAMGQLFVRPPGHELDLLVDAVSLIDLDVFHNLARENAQTSIDDRLKDVTVPVLLICGERDAAIQPARQHDMARKLRCCKEVVFSSEGHMLPNESAAMTAREISAFLDHDQPAMAAELRRYVLAPAENG